MRRISIRSIATLSLTTLGLLLGFSTRAMAATTAENIALVESTINIGVEDATFNTDDSGAALWSAISANKGELSTYLYANLRGVQVNRKYNANGGVSTYHFTYNDTASELAMVNSHVASTAPSLKGATTYETILKVHDYICGLADYDYATYNGLGDARGAYDVFFNGKAVCSGYALAFQAYMEYFGIPSYYAKGTVNGGSHAWNIVQLEDGQWYHVDCTWDGQTATTTHEYFLTGADTCGYSTWGSSSSTMVTMAPSAYAN